MSFKIGIVGLPNVGKSTLFNSLTNAKALAANFPFATIEPNVGVVAVPDERLSKLAALYNSEKIVPTAIEFVDIAGLVEGAHKGEGLGNQFLSHIREVDAIMQVNRIFDNGDIIHVSGSVDAERDKKTIEIELQLADLQTVTKRLESLQKLIKNGDKDAVLKQQALNKISATLNEGNNASQTELSKEEVESIKELKLLTQKSFLYVFNTEYNISTKEYKTQSNLSPLNPIYIDAQIESELSDLEEAEKAEYLKELGMTESGLDKIIKHAYQTLGLITFFTVGPKEAHAWTLEMDSKAPQAAGKIHTDFEKGFIRSETISWDKLLEAGSEAKAKEKGWLRIEGKEYVMQDGDVVHFRFNV